MRVWYEGYEIPIFCIPLFQNKSSEEKKNILTSQFLIKY